MTKEELEKESKDYAKVSINSYKDCLVDIGDKDVLEEAVSEAYLAGAELREKRIAELEETNADLKQSLDWANERESEDVKRIAELEAKIEKMKCCSNCVYQGECDLSGYEECKNFDKWEIKEK